MKLTHPFVILGIGSAALILAAWQFSEWRRTPATAGPTQANATHQVSAPLPTSSRLVQNPSQTAPPTTTSSDTQQSAVEKIVRAQLKDPESARFQNIRQVGRGEICGQVNAKNAFGGYVGFQHFWLKDIEARRPTLLIDSSDSRLAGVICDHP